jgi:2-hydroxy-3-keto-5-methylthiopentenyl-1-phosphate phosphatase
MNRFTSIPASWAFENKWRLDRRPDLFEADAFDNTIIPVPANAEIWIDFDGTITRQDVLDELIRRYAVDDSWQTIERQWQIGIIGSRECLSRQLALLRITESELESVLNRIQLDAGLHEFIELVQQNYVPVTVLSDGLDFIISRLLRRANLGHVRFRSNSADLIGDSLRLRCPFSNHECTSASAHCKCKSMEQCTADGREAIYIGDGRSDLCPARKAKCRFAKGVLAANLAKEGLGFIPYSNLSEVGSVLEAGWSGYLQ